MLHGRGDEFYAYAVKLASWFCRQRSLHRHQREDVLQDMLVGMSQAAIRFDQSRGVLFETFARKRMFGEAIDGLARRGGVPRSAWARGVRPAQALLCDTPAFRMSDSEVDSARLVRAFRVLEEVSPLLRRTVEAVYTEKATPAQVAVELGLNNAQVQQFLIRGLQLFRLGLKADQRSELTMNTTPSDLVFSAAQWRAELRRTVRKLVTPEVIQQLVQRQIELAKAGDRHALNFLLKQCGLNELSKHPKPRDIPTTRASRGTGNPKNRSRLPRGR